MSRNDERSSEKYGDSSQLTNWILDSEATCHMTSEVSDFVPGSLEDTDKYIEVADVHHVTAKQKGQVRMKMCDNHGNPFIATCTQHTSQASSCRISLVPKVRCVMLQ